MRNATHYGNQSIQLNEAVYGFGGNARVAEVNGPDIARVKVTSHDPVLCYVQRDRAGRLCAIRRVLITDTVYA